MVEALARRSEASDGMVEIINRLLAGTHPATAFVTRVRNQLGFHWDPAPLREWVDRYDRPNVIWLDGRGGPSNGDTLYRAASDAVVYSILPPTDEERAMPPDEQERMVEERFKQALRNLTEVMAVLPDYFERALATFLREAGATSRRLNSAAKASSA